MIGLAWEVLPWGAWSVVVRGSRASASWVITHADLAGMGSGAPQGFLACAAALVEVIADLVGSGLPVGSGLSSWGAGHTRPRLGVRWNGVREPAKHWSVRVAWAIRGGVVLLETVFAPGNGFCPACEGLTV